MRRILLSIYTLLIAFSVTSAQVESGFGLRAGLGLSKYTISVDGTSVNFGTDANIYVRAAYVLPVAFGGAIQLEAGYSGRGIDLNDSFLGGDEAALNLSYLDFGAFYRQQFGSGSVSFFVLGGPLISLGLSGNAEANGIKEGINFEDSGFNRLDLGIELGAGLLFGPQRNIAVEVRYSNGFIDLGQDFDDGNFTHSAFNFGLGYFF